MTTKTLKEGKPDLCIKQINEHMEKMGWQTQSEDLDSVIGKLTPKQIFEADNLINTDLVPYLSSFHVSWLFEVCWADPEYEPNDDRPVGYDENKPLNKVKIWAPQDYI